MSDMPVSPINSANSPISDQEINSWGRVNKEALEKTKEKAEGLRPHDDKFTDALQQARAPRPDVAQTRTPQFMDIPKDPKKEAERLARKYEEEGDGAMARGDYREASRHYSDAVEAVRGWESDLSDDLAQKLNEAEIAFAKAHDSLLHASGGRATADTATQGSQAGGSGRPVPFSTAVPERPGELRLPARDVYAHGAELWKNPGGGASRYMWLTMPTLSQFTRAR